MVLFIEILLIGVGLSMDAFAVSICKGLGMTKVNRKHDDAVMEKDLALNQGEMLLLAIATSIDALAVGIMFAFTYDSLNIYWAIAIIGLTTFVLSIIGVIVGNFFGNKYKKKSEIAGGIILILIGVKILLEHLGIISF